MLDAQRLRNDLPAVGANLARRGFALDTDLLDDLQQRRKAGQEAVEELRAARNETSRAVGVAKQKGEDTAELIAAGEAINRQLAGLEQTLTTVQEELNAYALTIPNTLHDTVPDGLDESANAEIRRQQTPPVFDFTAQPHDVLGEQLGGMDFALAAKLTATRFVTMRGALARLHRALAQFMLDLHIGENGYTEVYMPFLGNAATFTGTGQLPKFEEDLFYAARDGLYLIPTAEVMVTNVVRDSIVDDETLPMRLVCHTPCFRREAGSYGRDTRGMLRQHQFEKVELVHICMPDDSYAELERMTAAAEGILQRLQLPYRVVSLCGGDIGFAAAKTYDIEVWLPGQNAYREISSCSNCEDFQARRMRARYRLANGKTAYLHTLNGSGVAVGRAMIAVMENYQQADGSIIVPPALRPYMGGLTQISPSSD